MHADAMASSMPNFDSEGDAFPAPSRQGDRHEHELDGLLGSASRHDFGVVAINVGTSCADAGRLAAVWSAARRQLPVLRVAFVAEVDLHGEGPPQLDFDEFSLFRHYPGRGSRSMAFCVCRTLVPHVTCQWTGRAGVCEVVGLSQRGARDLCVIGWHGAHQEAFWDSLADLRTVCRSARGCQTVVVGDFNVDYSPTLALPEPELPFPLPPRDDEFADERAAVDAVVAANGLSVHVPSVIADSPGGPWGLYCTQWPVTRIASGGQATRQRPSLLDLVAADSSLGDVTISWCSAPADHAMIFFAAGARPT